MTGRSRLACAVMLAGTLSGTSDAAAQEYRGFWVDTFNTSLNNHANVLAVVNNAVAANANAIFVQVRRRGDSWYLDSLEPPPEPSFISPGFDPLQDLVSTGHAAGLEVHAFVIVGAITNRDPAVTPRLPASPTHAFNLHGGFDPATKTIVQGPDNWLTRSLLPDLTGVLTYQGHRFMSSATAGDFWLDFGHPDAAAYTVDVLMHLVRHYDIDGLHLDRIRYPEIGVSGQTRLTGTSVGYNPTSVERFHRYYGEAAGSPPPAQNDTRWSQWRRDQITNLVRRIYLNAVAAKPHLKVSAALITFGSGPATEAAWVNTEPYWRVYQDWRAWTEEGIVDLAIPMNYKAEHTSSTATQYNQWLEWTKNHQYNRMALIGQGGHVNAIEGTLRQTRRSRLPSSLGNYAGGMLFFSMATSNIAIPVSLPFPLGNPYRQPTPGPTPVRSFPEFASALKTGKSVNGLVNYEDTLANPEGVFAAPTTIPLLPWKLDPQTGHLKGFVRTAAGAAIDTGAIRIERDGADTPPAGRTSVTNATDGGGFYGGVDLAPGTYRVTVTPVGDAPYASCPVVVRSGEVATLDVTVDRDAPTTTITADPRELWAPNSQEVTVTIGGQATDAGTGIASIAFRILDEYGEVEPVVATEIASGGTSLSWSRQVSLQASRRGGDRDGRTYTIVATVVDRACNATVVSTTVRVAHDQRGLRPGF